MRNSALRLLSMGFSVIPVRPDKKTYLASWKEYQTRLPTEAEVRTWWLNWPNAGIAIVAGKISGLTLIDCDTYRVPGCDKLIEDNLGLDIPAQQRTPRGGRHFIFAYTPGLKQTQKINGIDIRNDGGYFLVCPTPGYSWDLPFDEVGSLPVVPDTIVKMLQDAPTRHTVEPGQEILVEGRRDDDIFSAVNAWVKAGWPVEKIRPYALALAKTCVPPFSEKEAEAKIESALKRHPNRPRPLAEIVEEWVGYTVGYFSVTDLDRELQLVTSGDKNNRKQIIHRLVRDKVIERFPNKNGVFRRVITEYREIDLSTIEEETIPVFYPFQIERLVDTMPKNIIVVAGEPDSGKTSFLLNFAHMNMRAHRIRYLTSEMSGPELKTRLSKFATRPRDWAVQFIERATNFADLTLPDDITLIDYLELSDNFFLVAGMIKEIFDKLNNGIAVIALQKNRGTDLGLGGFRSLEKARLYLALGQGRCKIVKGKNWHSDTNPNGLIQNFKLVNGADFIRMGEWHKEQEPEK